jgi:hypothetical protein
MIVPSRHRLSGACRAAQQQVQVAADDVGVRRCLVGQEGEAEVAAVEVACFFDVVDQLRSLTRARLLRRLRAVRPARHQDAELRGTLIALRALARRVQALTAEERELKREIQALVARLARTLRSTSRASAQSRPRKC